MIIIFILLTTATLFLGLLSMAIGGKFSKKFTTRLMSLRVAFQTIAIVALIMLYFIS